jgi:PAS domain S-box-containing protein
MLQQGGVPLFSNLDALMMEIGAASLLALLFAFVRRQVRPKAYFVLWERAWMVLAVALVAMFLRHLPGVPPLAGSMVYQVGKFTFFALLLLGAVAYVHPERVLPVGPASAAMAFVGVVTAWITTGPAAAVLWQSPFAAVLCGMAGWQFAGIPAAKRTYGSRATAAALLLYATMWTLYGVHLVSPESPIGAPLAPLVRAQVYIDSLTLGALGFGMILLVMEDARRVASESEQRLQTLIASTTDALLLLDWTLRVQGANPAAERLFDASSAALQGRELLSLFEVSDEVTLREGVRRFAAEGGDEFRMGESDAVLARRSSGIPVRVEGSLWRLPGDRGEIAAILRDVTVREELRTRQAMQAKTDAVRQLAAGIAHDFNNLLTSISTRSQMLLAERAGDARVRETVSEITDATASAARLARDLLSLSGRQSLQPTLIDINSAVRSLEQAVRERLPQGVAVDFRYAIDAGRVRVDGIRFGDALLALAQPWSSRAGAFSWPPRVAFAPPRRAPPAWTRRRSTRTSRCTTPGSGSRSRHAPTCTSRSSPPRGRGAAWAFPPRSVSRNRAGAGSPSSRHRRGRSCASAFPWRAMRRSTPSWRRCRARSTRRNSSNTRCWPKTTIPCAASCAWCCCAKGTR